MEPLSGFEHATPELGIHHLNQPFVNFSKIKEQKNVGEKALIFNTDDNNMNNLQAHGN